ncbi:MAG TPA: ribosome biogenesis GTP-binding protein YihA/YsxC [Gemmatimonadales bacterium]|nr:ribosome biogenesis GTP-binding protein YihA/YsxC [Gemmatimonadales bacterium]
MRHRRPAAPAGHRTAPPEERSLTDPRFVGSFPRADVTLDPPHPEIAFLGRSNVGKSSLLNALVGRRIAKVSASPGKTKMLNVFEIGIGDWGLGIRGHQSPIPNAESPTVYLLDLPGYGYARTSKVERAGFRPLLDGTLNRSTLSGVVWLLDIRHDLSKEDREIRDLLSGIGVRTLAALTKGDKLPRGTGRKREAELAAELELDDDQVLLTSAKTGTGLDELREALAGLIGKAAG